MGGRAVASDVRLRVPDPWRFSRAGRSPFSGKKVKTPTLPNAGRVGQPKNLNQKLRIGESQLKDWPPAGSPAFENRCSRSCAG
jgi:hypothetical protein